MAAHVRLKNEFTEDEKCHNLMSWLVWSRLQLCGAVDQTTFLSLFELLGEAYLISSYSEQPLPFQSEPFPG